MALVLFFDKTLLNDIPDTFTGFILICIITVSSTTIVLLTVGLKTAERSLIYKKAIRTIQTTKS